MISRNNKKHVTIPLPHLPS